jgi:hypothetical protein
MCIRGAVMLYVPRGSAQLGRVFDGDENSNARKRLTPTTAFLKT